MIDTDNKEKLFFIEVAFGIECKSEDIPDEVIFINPLKEFLKKRLELYKDTYKLVRLKTEITESIVEED